MNLRILKKLSKRAAPYLPLLGDQREVFPAEKGENYLSTVILDRACWERGRSAHGDTLKQREIKKPAADGKGWVWMAPPDHPLEGTPMIGGMSGYYEPEWSEEDCWYALQNLVFAHFTDWELMAEWNMDDGPPPRPVIQRDLSSVALIFKAADELVAQRQGRH